MVSKIKLPDMAMYLLMYWCFQLELTLLKNCIMYRLPILKMISIHYLCLLLKYQNELILVLKYFVQMNI